MKSNFARTIESAIMANWDDLLPVAPRIGSVHVEYAFAAGGELNRLEVWSSTVRGHWLLACTYADAAAYFNNGIESKALAQTLDTMMRNQKAFILPENTGPHGLLQIETPTPEQRTAATAAVDNTLKEIGCAST